MSYTRFATALDLGAGALTLTNSVNEMRAAVEVHAGIEAGLSGGYGYELSSYDIAYDVGSPGTSTQLFDLRQRPMAEAVYYQESWRPTPRLLVEAGLRPEHVTGRAWSGLSPRAAVKWFVTPDLALSAATGRYAQWLHSLNREDIPVRVFDFWVASDEYIDVSRATHVVLGVERWLGPIRFARVEGWVKRYDNLLEQNPADDPARRGDEFLDAEGTSYGFDVLLRQLDAGPLERWLSYTYAVSQRTQSGTGYWPGPRPAPQREPRRNLARRPQVHLRRAAWRERAARRSPTSSVRSCDAASTPSSTATEPAGLAGEREPLGGPAQRGALSALPAARPQCVARGHVARDAVRPVLQPRQRVQRAERVHLHLRLHAQPADARGIVTVPPPAEPRLTVGF